MNLYNVHRALQAGKQIFYAKKEDRIRAFFASSFEQAQSKFTGWSIFEKIDDKNEILKINK